MRRLLITPLAVFLISAPTPAGAYGPGVHIREAERSLELLLDDGPQWATDAAEAELATAYLRLGSIAPDFQWATDHLGFGHGKTLAYHLLQEAEALTPQHRLFALGVLAHIASDASSEVFFAPTIFASAPLGPYDLFEGDDDNRAETEAICEAYGDLVLGDWDAVVDVLFDFRLDGPEAWERFEAIFLWYCETGSAFYGGGASCEPALGEIGTLLTKADTLLGALDREGAKAVVALLVDQPLVDLFHLYTGGLLDTFLPGATAPSADYDYFANLFLQSALVTDELWALYEDAFTELGPRLTRDHLTYEVTGWPEYDGKSLISGNVQSMLQFLPDEYEPMAHLHVTHVGFRDADDEPIESVSPALVGSTVTAEVRFFSSLDHAGTIGAVVRRDLPGLDRSGDDVVGEAEVAVDINPHQYSLEPQTWLEIEFVANTQGALGFYVELSADGGEKPWMTTSWDRIWTLGDLELDRAIYRDHFGTYGHWPPSLPIAEPDVSPAQLFARVHVAPAGPPIAGALVDLADAHEPVTTGPNGLAAFGGVEAGEQTLTATAEGFAVGEAIVELLPLEMSWTTLALHADPAPALPEYVSHATCWGFSFAVEAFADQAETFFAWPIQPDSGESLAAPSDVGASGEGEVCATNPLADGDRVAIIVQARYPDETDGMKSESGVAIVDTSAADIYAIDIDSPHPLQCTSATGPRATSIAFETRDNHSGILEASWRVTGAEDWISIGIDLSPDGPWAEGGFDVPTGTEDTPVELRAINGAGLIATERIVVPGLPLTVECADAGTAEPDAAARVDDPPEQAGAEPEAGAPKKKADGCRWTPRAPAMPLFFVLLLLWAKVCQFCPCVNKLHTKSRQDAP